MSGTPAKTESSEQLLHRLEELERRVSRLELREQSHHPHDAAPEWAISESSEPALQATASDAEHARNATVELAVQESAEPVLQVNPSDAEHPHDPAAEWAKSDSSEAASEVTPWGSERTPDYFWVVTCKNHRFHHKEQINYEHRILLGETDFYSSRPILPSEFKVRCDNCGKEYWYLRREVLRVEVQVHENFTPHPLFSAPA